VRDFAIYIHDLSYPAFGQFDGTIRTGKSTFEEIFGMPFYRHLQENPDRAAIFHAGIGNRGRIQATSIVEAYDFSTSRQVVDVGGGNGSFLSEILAAHANVSGVLIDRSVAIEAAKSGQGGSLPRCEFIDGDIFEDIFAGGDTYILKRILFDFSDEDAVCILNKCRSAIANDGRLLIIEMLQAPANQEDLSHALDLMFLVTMGGQTRTEEQYAELLAQSKFKFVKSIPTESDVTILEAAPA
jgi:ubiquinone/menaquinone biosynthesis C-methylase UbiE